jgi:plastocyanin domain-containing protein
MTLAQTIVNLAGLAAIGWIVWYVWLYRKEGVRVAAAGSVQELNITTARGGYDPDTIVVKKGKPVKLNFTRQESAL